MTFLISLALAAVLIAAGHGFMKKHANLCYLIAVAVSLTVVGCAMTGAAASFPTWVRTWIWPMFQNSALATALFAAVMYANAVPRGSALMKLLMPIRAELSIIASILTLGHNIAYGRTYFRMLFTQPERLPTNQLLAAVCSLVMLCIMLPLFITSFPAVRKKMNARNWKKLQRLAYGFYALIYVHVLLLMVPMAQRGSGTYMFTVLVYSVVFLTYAAMRISKTLANRTVGVRRLPALASACAMAVVCVTVMLPDLSTPAAAQQSDHQPESGVVSSQEDREPAEGSEELPAVSQSESPVGSEPDLAASSADEPEEDADNQVQLPTEPQEQPESKPQDEKEPESKPEQPAPQPEHEPTPEPTPELAPEPAPAPQPEPESEPEPVPEPPAVVYQYKDGTFTGSADGFNGPITVSVTIQSDKITAISVVSTTDDEPFLSDAKGVISRMLSSNSANVSGVSGATFSSQGIINAVKAAMSSAKN